MMLCLLAARQATAEPVLRAYAGANGVWYDGDNPNDFEAGGNLRASLSPHISLVGAGYYGFSHSYLRGSAGLRITATDANDPNFSVGIGMQRHFSSEPDIRPEEWAPDASIGWRPWAATNPRVILIAQAGYGLDTEKAFALAGVRYEFGGER
jgi:hypothetical protein